MILNIPKSIESVKAENTYDFQLKSLSRPSNDRKQKPSTVKLKRQQEN